jgi:inorganic pyrophosphatase
MGLNREEESSVSKKQMKLNVLKDGIVEIVKEFAANIIVFLIPLLGILIISFIIPNEYLLKYSSEQMDVIGFLVGLFILYSFSGVIAFISAIRNRIELKKNPIGKTVKVTIDRPLGTYHPKHKDIYYSVNYGYIKGVVAGDGEEQDAYILGVDEPINKFIGVVIAIVHRLNDNEDKWIVVPNGFTYSEEEIIKQIEFQEKYFEFEIYM